MTTAAEHHDSQLAAIKARHEEVRHQLRDPAVTELKLPPSMRLDQTGLSAVMVDKIGRFWNVDGETLKVVFDPKPARAPLYSPADIASGLRPIGQRVYDVHAEKWITPGVPDTDDTQAAQGFPAKE